MKNYLNETYSGSSTNMLLDSAYYCYTLKDIQTGKYYSGSRGIEGKSSHDLLDKYFTSSTVIDFKQKLKQFPELFIYIVEYFPTRYDAFEAERAFHDEHQVGKNPIFINAMSAGRTNCGAGSVLCKDNEGNTYRITVEEFATGKHVHVSKGMMNVRTDTGIKKIYTVDFDPNIHTTQFNNYVLAIDKVTGNTCRINKDKFELDDRYVGVTKGIVHAYDTATNSHVLISQDQFKQSNGRYVGKTFGMVTVIDLVTGEQKRIQKEQYDKNLYKYHNSGIIMAYSLIDKKIVSVSRDEYQQNNSNYANRSTLIFYKVDGIFFKSKQLLDVYYRETRHKSVLSTNQFRMSIKFKDIESITRSEHQNGKN